MRLHPKYKIPAECFAHVADANDLATWKMPCRLADGQVGLKRLPTAIQSVFTNYRGAGVAGMPDCDIPDVLACLARGAESAGKMPHQGKTAPAYQWLAEALKCAAGPVPVERNGRDEL